MKNSSLKKIINIGLLMGIIIGSTYFTVPIKATDKVTVLVVWQRIKVTNSYDDNKEGEFRIQVKYYTGSKWMMDESAKYSTEALTDEVNPEIHFQLRYDVSLGSNFYIRMIEDDGWLKDDQIIKPMVYNTGSKIDNGNWYIGFTMVSSSWETIYKSGTNDQGDYFKVKLINLDY